MVYDDDDGQMKKIKYEIKFFVFDQYESEVIHNVQYYFLVDIRGGLWIVWVVLMQFCGYYSKV